MILKSTLITTVILFCHLVFFGQSGFPYDAEWKSIDSLMNKKNLPKSALTEVNKVYAAAKKDKYEAQWIKAIIYRNHLQESDDRNINQEDSELESEITDAPPRVVAVLKSIEAERLFQYLQANRYQMEHRTTIVSDTSADISTWTINRMSQKIRSLYLSSLDIPLQLKQTPLSFLDPVLIKGNARELRPTVFDLLANRALDYFHPDYSGQMFGSNDSLMNNPALFSDAPFFTVYDFSGKDSGSNQAVAIKIYQQLLRFHAKDARLDAWIDADICRIQFVHQYAKMDTKDSLYMNALGRITGKFPTLSAVSRAWYLRALWWSNQAGQYNPLGDTLHRFDNLKAIALCNQAIRHPDSSEGKSNCEELLRRIKRSSYYLNIEQVNIPGLPFRALVTYKQVNRLYGRIIKIEDATREMFDQHTNDLKYWSELIQLQVYKKFIQDLPETNDYQQHRVEIKLDALPIGQYALLTSSDSAFSDEAIIGLTTFFCSSIAYMKNESDYFILDRDSGHPLKGVKIKVYNQHYANGGIKYTFLKTYQSDIHGYFNLAFREKYSNLKMEFYYGKDYFSTAQYISYYRNDADDEDEDYDKRKTYEKDKLEDYLFTDRSIYRPGQTVYFKGLLMTKDFKTRKYKVVAGQKTKIYLVDENDKQIDSLIVISNEFGSIHGTFKLPQEVLGGIFKIREGSTFDEQYFSVEEYKRPSFFVEYDSLKGSFKVGDSIHVTGYASAYAGYAIGGVKMSYRVVRESRFPYPWLFRQYPSNAETEITHGVTVTDQNGKFAIYFSALPDRSIQIISKPVYTYRVETTVTDGNGESRSASTVVSVSYQSIEIASPLPFQSRMFRDSLYQIPVTTKNAAGIFVKSKMTVRVYPLQGPGRLIRNRYWAEPDQFVINELEFVKSFPNDEYRDELSIRSWKIGSRLIEKTDSTNANGLFALDEKTTSTVNPGWYLFEFRVIDNAGEEIVDKRFVQILSDKAISGSLLYNQIREENITTEPGIRIKIQTGSDAKDLFVIRIRKALADSIRKYSFFNLSQEIKTSSMEIEETNRGGFSLNDVFVKNNRWYISEHNIQVPWTNKEIQISYQTWKDKTLPGNKEQWKIRISGHKKDQLTAEILTSMYDASLDQFKNHTWSTPDIYPIYNKGNTWNAENNFIDLNSMLRPLKEIFLPPVNQKIYDALLDFERNNISLQGVVRGINLLEPAPGGGKATLDEVVTTGYSSVKKDLVSDKATGNSGNAEKEQQPERNDQIQSGNIQIRKNFNETAFFQPDLKTDAQGDVEISFTMPDALTKWKWMVLANTKDLSFGYSEKIIVTQKEFMLQTNMPRFFRAGDTMLLPVKISNLSSRAITGEMELQWIDADNNQAMDIAIDNFKSSQPFTVNALQSGVVFFPATIPADFSQPLIYRIIAKTNMNGAEYSDGEENIIPVLGNRILVTESLPVNMDGKDERSFNFEKLLKSNSSTTIQNQSITVEFTANPAWYAVEALPYLMEFPYECAEQTFNRFYANAMAFNMVKGSPALQTIFEKWKHTDTAALLSNLLKNEEIKSVLLCETPWVLQATSETQQKKNLALLFDMIKMQQALKSALVKLQQMQSEGGGFAWFKGGQDDRYITQYILAGIGKLKKLKAIPAELQGSLDKMVRSALQFADLEIGLDYTKRNKSITNQGIDPSQIQYLYMHSFFPEIPVPANISTAYNYFSKLSSETWMKQSVYMQGMIALYLNRAGEIKTSKDILASLKENASSSSALGMYWKSVNPGYIWQEAPVETQSLLIETFGELKAGQKDIDEMKFWLLQQKRTNHWPTTKATADACYALLVNGSDWLATQQSVTIRLGNYKINSADEKTEAGTGYLKKRIPGDQVKPEMGNIQITVNHQPASVSPSWGAIYWQYFENLDKITTAQTQLSVRKQLFIEINTDKGPVLVEVSPSNVLKPGDKLKMRLIIRTDRDLEYVHLKDMRAACLEPANVLSGYHWQNGLGYYQTTQDASTSFFFDRLSKGVYVFEYPVFVTTAGNYSNGISNLECMYAPEFAAHSEGIRIQVKSK